MGTYYDEKNLTETNILKMIFMIMEILWFALGKNKDERPKLNRGSEWRDILEPIMV